MLNRVIARNPKNKNKITKRFKILVIMAAIVLVVVYFQLLRGDRESLPWLLGLIVFYYYWGSDITQKPGFVIPWLRVFCVLSLFTFISLVLGSLRSSVASASFDDSFSLIVGLFEASSFDFSNIVHGTWSAALLTPLSVSGDYVHNILPIKWGQDYLDLLLSIIPGFLADAIGYHRPIDGHQGPAFAMRYGLGGTHALVLPFMNFRMFGVFLTLCAWGFLLVYYERRLLKNLCVKSFALLITLTMAFPHWLWYGDKNIINAILLWCIFTWFYKVSLSFNSLGLVKFNV